MVEALQVESDRTFLALTENRLNDIHGVRAELMNFGISGATQTEELLILKNDVVRFSPDMVLLFFMPHNDIRDVARQTASPTERPYYDISENGELILDVSFRDTREFRPKCSINYLRQRSALISLFGERYSACRASRAKRAKAPSDGKGLHGYLSLCTDNPSDTYLKNYDLNKALMKAMSEYCNERDIRFMIVCTNTGAYIPEKADEFATVDATFNANFFEDDLKNFAGLLGVEYLGLQREFSSFYERNRIPLHWGHWNYEGHRVVADALANKLSLILKPNANRGEHVDE